MKEGNEELRAGKEAQIRKEGWKGGKNRDREDPGTRAIYSALPQTPKAAAPQKQSLRPYYPC